jgi:hypothetical protein
MKTLLNAVILALSVTCLTVFIVYTRNITPETPMFNTLKTIAYGWTGLYLLRLYWKESEGEHDG